MALCERDENVQSTQLKQTQSTCHDSTISDHRYPDWLLEHRKRKCFVLEDFAVHKDLLGRGKFGKILPDCPPTTVSADGPTAQTDSFCRNSSASESEGYRTYRCAEVIGEGCYSS